MDVHWRSHETTVYSLIGRSTISPVSRSLRGAIAVSHSLRLLTTRPLTRRCN